MKVQQSCLLQRASVKQPCAPRILPHHPRQACPVRMRSSQQEQEQDLVTSIVGKIFGQKAVDDPNPMGMKRMDWSKVKDLEVVMDREAVPVEGDDPYMQLIRPMLAGTSLEDEALRLAYSASEDGWTPQAFHNAVHGYGPCVVWARTKGGAVCGGYNPLGFDGYGMDKASMGAFLFTWPNGDTKESKPHKLAKVGTDQQAVIDRMDRGPQFGPGDFKVMLSGGKQDYAKASSKLVDYQRPPGGSKTLFAPGEGNKTELVELRAYVRKGGKLKYELDGIRWKSSYVKDGSGEGPPPGIMQM